MTDPSANVRNGIIFFAAGALIGAGVALLLAPQSGAETRKLLVKKARQLRGQAQDTVADALASVTGGKDGHSAEHDSDGHAQHRRG